MSRIPEIRLDRGIPTLYVKGEPFLALSGEVHNSSAESLSYMEEKVWAQIEGMNLNTLVVPLYWDRMEPQDGVMDFTLLDGLVKQAREHEKHLILLWFGLWKNAESMYVPGWMKQDTKTYFRVEKVSGEKTNTISPLCEAAIARDAAAFRKIMAHIREIDGEEFTVIMMQVENEVGLLGTVCDFSQPAREAFAGKIPEELVSYAVKRQQEGTSQRMTDAGETICKTEKDKETELTLQAWKEVFGEDAEEIFMAYHFAKAIETITAAGQKEYPLPCYVNAWLRQFPWYAGSYPSGGPVRNVHEVWKIAAPSLFTMAPDIYVPYVADIMEEYSYEGNPLVIPEVRKDAVTAAYAFYAFMEHHALCYSPFGIEDLGETADETNNPTKEMIEALKMDPLSFDLTGSRNALTQVYDLINQIKPLYLKFRGTSHMQSYLQKTDREQGDYFRFKEYNIEVDYLPKMPGCPAAAGTVIELEENKFLIAGMMTYVKFFSKLGENKKAEFLKIECGQVINGEFRGYKEMNGDERMAVIMMNQPTCYLIELYKY